MLIVVSVAVCSTMSPVQRIVTTQKGVALAFDSVCREAKAQSRELYTWGQHEDADIKDGMFTTRLVATVR